jgi:hypothetical protein
MTSPTFVATFSDGTVTRMTTNCADGFDLGRGVRLSQAAYELRKRKRPPAMIAGHFETPPNGDSAAVILRSYTADDLRGCVNDISEQASQSDAVMKARTKKR